MTTILTKKILVVTVISTGVFLATMNSQAEIYKWTDAKGVTHYSAQKPIQQKIKSENIEDKIRSAAGKYQTSSRKPVQTSSRKKAKKSANGKTKTELAGPSAKLVSFCKNQRKNLATLKNNYRNSWQEKSGKTSFLNQEQRKVKVKKIQESITKECAGV